MSKKPPFDEIGKFTTHPEYRSVVRYTGTGRPDCPQCKGTGRTPIPGRVPPGYYNCRCTSSRSVALNLEAAWKGLGRAPNVEYSPLPPYLNRNVWVRSPVLEFQKHLRYAAIRYIATHASKDLTRSSSKTPWFFKVVTDAELVQAWLATAASRGVEIHDPDAIPSPSQVHLTLVDLVSPPEFLIIRLGVKQAANKETATVLHEALAMRFHEGKPTWIWDQPMMKLQEGHLCYDPLLMDDLALWGYIGPLKIGAQDAEIFGVHEMDAEDYQAAQAEADSCVSPAPSTGRVSQGLLGNVGAPVPAPPSEWEKQDRKRKDKWAKDKEKRGSHEDPNFEG